MKRSILTVAAWVIVSCACSQKNNPSLTSTDSLIKTLLVKQSVITDSVRMMIEEIKNKQPQVIVMPPAVESNIPQILTVIVSLLAIAIGYFGVYKQMRLQQKNQQDTQNRQWCYELIQYVSELINEIDKHKTSDGIRLMEGKNLSEKQAILEIKIDLLLDDSQESEKKLLETVLAYKKNKAGSTGFVINNWLENIKTETHSVINTKWP